MTPGQNIKALMDAKGWTPERLAVATQEAGEPLTVPAIKQWLTGRNGPSGQSVVALAKALGCSTDDILLGGHNRYAICTKHGVPFETVDTDLAGKLDAVMQHAIPALLDLCYCEETEEDEQCEYCERIANFRAILEPTP